MVKKNIQHMITLLENLALSLRYFILFLLGTNKAKAESVMMTWPWVWKVLPGQVGMSWALWSSILRECCRVRGWRNRSGTTRRKLSGTAPWRYHPPNFWSWYRNPPGIASDLSTPLRSCFPLPRLSPTCTSDCYGTWPGGCHSRPQ